MDKNNKKINVLMIIDSLGIGGAEVSLRSLTNSMVEMGHNVVVLVIRDEILLKLSKKVSIEILGYKKYKYLPSTYINAKKLRHFIVQLEKKYGIFQLKVSHLTLSHKLSSLAGLKGVYYCIHENITASNLANRSGLKKYFRMLRIRKLYNNKNIIVVSNGVKDSLIMINKLYPKSLKTIYNAIDMISINELSAKDNPYAMMQYIVHVGRFSITQKRHDILLMAYQKIKSDFKLILVGDGPDRGRIIAMIHQMKLEDRVVLAGFHKNPYPIIRGSSLLVLSSDYEGFGVVLAEALCLDTAVISTNCKSGPDEIMESSLSKYLVNTGDADALADKMKQAIDDVSNANYPFASACLERFSPDTIARQYFNLVD